MPNNRIEIARPPGQSAAMTDITLRVATLDDLPGLSTVMDAAIGVLQVGFLDAAQIEASRAVMGLDRQLIEDGTYLSR